MPRLTKPKRPGTPHALSGRGTTINIDQGTEDRLTWLRAVTKRAIKHEAGSSVVVRRAITLYQQYIEQLLQQNSKEAFAEEAGCLAVASRGTTEALPEEQLEAVPPRPFSAILEESHEAAAKARLETSKHQLLDEMERRNLRRVSGGRGG